MPTTSGKTPHRFIAELLGTSAKALTRAGRTATESMADESGAAHTSKDPVVSAVAHPLERSGILHANRAGLSRRELLRALGAWIVVPSPHYLDDLLGSPGMRDGHTGENEEANPPPAPLFLTFDDGPLDCTAGMLDCLGEHGQKATFFVIGKNLTNRKYRDVAIRALKEGHDIGNHSYTHPGFSSIGTKRIEEEIRKTYEVIEDVVLDAGVDATRQNLFFRFPYGDEGHGSSHRAAQTVLSRLGYRIASWTRDTHDWQMEMGGWWTQPWRVFAILRQAQANDVVLMHDRNRTARILPSAIEVLTRKRLVSVPLSKFDQLLAEAVEEGSSPDESVPQGWGDYLGIRSLLEELLPGTSAE